MAKSKGKFIVTLCVIAIVLMWCMIPGLISAASTFKNIVAICLFFGAFGVGKIAYDTVKHVKNPNVEVPTNDSQEL